MIFNTLWWSKDKTWWFYYSYIKIWSFIKRERNNENWRNWLFNAFIQIGVKWKVIYHFKKRRRNIKSQFWLILTIFLWNWSRKLYLRVRKFSSPPWRRKGHWKFVFWCAPKVIKIDSLEFDIKFLLKFSLYLKLTFKSSPNIDDKEIAFFIRIRLNCNKLRRPEPSRR